MPEIKHNFANGKMNKDLDERIVPNGEYRDAVNIQVATSEDSDVGTIQNILSNYAITSQGIINEDSYCVGSIADEKNDSLYYFITSTKNQFYSQKTYETSQAGADNAYAGPSDFKHHSWLFLEGVFIDSTNAKYQNLNYDTSIGGSGRRFYNIPDDLLNFNADENGITISSDPNIQTTQYSNAQHQIDLVDGETYRIKVEFENVDNGNDASSDQIKWFLAGHSLAGGDVNYRPFGNRKALDGVLEEEFTFDASLNNSVPNMIFVIEMGNGNQFVKSLTLKNISLVNVTRAVDIILKYDTKKDNVTPVLIDSNGDVLKFEYGRHITGINIIDDLLFFTDNNNEPKKININRCIKGTSSYDPALNGPSIPHTNFINETTGLSVPIREEHITVIKKQPIIAPTIDLVSERPDLPPVDVNGVSVPQTYTGVIRVARNDSGSAFVRGADNLANNSSFWFGTAGTPGSAFNHLHDFVSMSVGERFASRIETDINGDSGFKLNWSVGDVILFKEFGGLNFNEAPGIPITDYRVKARIVSWYINDFTDVPSDQITNGSFNTPTSNGSFVTNWIATGGPTFNAANQQIDFDAAGYSIITQSMPQLVIGGEYLMTVTVENPPGGSFSGEGNAYVVVESARFNNHPTTGSNSFGADDMHLFRIKFEAPGTYTRTCVLEPFHPSFNEPDNIGSYTPAGWTWSSPASNIDSQFRVYTGSGGGNFSVSQVKFERVDQSNAQCLFEIIDINGTPPTAPPSFNELKYAADKEENKEKIFKFKFPRIAYRYKYQDGEYSAISPFSQPAFLPGSFDFNPKKGYNLGMVNRAVSIEVKNYRSDLIPDGVVAVDLIFKEESSPDLYIIDTIKPNTIGSSWDDGNVVQINNQGLYMPGGYTISNEQIKNVIETNQILRPYDNVPKKALAQEITGNRVVYGNYKQGYNLITANTVENAPLGGGFISRKEYYPNFKFDFLTTDINSSTVKSIKTLREYQLGVVFVDEYGRETPVISNPTGTKALSKVNADKQNQIKIGFNNTDIPLELTYMKFFIKETSGEYYNLAMDRYYDGGEDRVWLSFPSSDINKVNIDDFIILKKAAESNQLVEEEAKYKILDIQAQAPEFIKDEVIQVARVTHDNSAVLPIDVFKTNLTDCPREGIDEFSLKYNPFAVARTGGQLHLIDTNEVDLYIEFFDVAVNTISKKYKIGSITTDLDVAAGVGYGDASYFIFTREKLGDDVNFMLNSAQTGIQDGIQIRFYKHVKSNMSKFDGKFFVQINKDSSTGKDLVLSKLEASLGNPTFRLLEQKKLFSMLGNHDEIHSSAFTGQNQGEYAKDFGRYAPFFRNYNANTINSNLGAEYTPYIFGEKLTSGGTYYQQTTAAGKDSDTASEDWPNLQYTAVSDATDYANSYTSIAGFSSSPTFGLTANQIAELGAAWYTEYTWFTGPVQYSWPVAVGDPYGVGGANGGLMQHRIDGSKWNGSDGNADYKVADKHGWSDRQRVNNTVWFIDAGPYKGKLPGINKYYNWYPRQTQWMNVDRASAIDYEDFSRNVASTGASQPLAGTGLSRGAVTDFNKGVETDGYNGQIDISWGGIFHNQSIQNDSDNGVIDDVDGYGASYDGSGMIDEFWNAGVTSINSTTNPEYTNSGHTDFTNNFFEGMKFRFTEDPSSEVYTVNRVQLNGHLRHTVGDGSRLSSVPSAYGPRYTNISVLVPLRQEIYAGDGWRSDSDLPFGTSSGNIPNFPYYNERWESNLWAGQVAEQFSPNFTTNSRLRFQNSSGDGAIGWNPIGAYGGIPGGLKISINQSSANAAQASNATGCIVSVDSLSGADENTGDQHTIKVGMILTSYNDGGEVLDGGADLADTDPPLIIYKIEDQGAYFDVFLTGYAQPCIGSQITTIRDTNDLNTRTVLAHRMFSVTPNAGEALVFEQPTYNGLSQYSANRINSYFATLGQHTGVGLFDPLSGHEEAVPVIMPVVYHLEILEEIPSEEYIPTNPAIWETEPQDNTPLDIYYEASGYHPLRLTVDTMPIAIPLGSDISHTGNPVSFAFTDQAIITGYGFHTSDEALANDSNYVGTAGFFITLALKFAGSFPLVGSQYIDVGSSFDVTRPDGTIVRLTIKGYFDIDADSRASSFYIEEDLHGPETSYILNWHNCFSFGNGVESNRIRDAFNLSKITNGVKASTTLEYSTANYYKEEHRKHGLIYSGIYNDIGGVNNLNQFITAEKITKDLNPTYGSIQKLYSRDTDLIAMCEDKVLQILANKDAVFNADGNPQLVATNRVLGQARPFVGEYGISKNPESFASESYRVYFADKVRGAIIRLSKDGLTAISDHGMKDWFKDNLKLSKKLIGSYDDSKGEYNITVLDTEKTVSFKENTRSWVSFKSFTPENAISCANKYFTMKNGWLWQHHYDNNTKLPQFKRNTFYFRHIVVEHIDHPNQPENPGKYFFFDQQRFIDNLHVDTLQTLGNPTDIQDFIGVVRVYRNNIMIHDAIDVKLWSKEDQYSVLGLAYGRIETGGSNPGDWQVGDVIVFYEFLRSDSNDNNLIPQGFDDSFDNISAFYNETMNNHFDKYVSSSFNVLLNEAPSSIKSYNTLSYEGSEALKKDKLATVHSINFPEDAQLNGQFFFLNEIEFNILVEQTNTVLEKIPDEETLAGDSTTQVLQYNSDDELIWQGKIRLFKNEDIGFYGSRLSNPLPGQFNVTDYITLHEVKKGWHVTDFKTDQQKGSLINFVKKENKWFNYIKGTKREELVEINYADGNVRSTFPALTSFEESSVQGIGNLKSYSLNVMEFESRINSALQIGDTVYYQNTNPSVDNSLQPNQIIAFGVVTEITEFTVTVNEAIFGDPISPTDDMFILFTKNNNINSSSLLGYYADVKFENNSLEKVELFSVGSEITESSK